MADITIDNGSLTDFKLKTRTGESSAEVQAVELALVSSGVTLWVPKVDGTAHSAGDAGLPIQFVRVDTPSTLTSSDGEYSFGRVDDSGRLWVAVGSMPATTRATDTISTTESTDSLMEGATALTVKRKSMTVAASQTDTEVVALVASKKIRVVALAHQCGSTGTTATYESNGGSDTRLHKIPAGANGGQVLPFNRTGWFETLAGEALIVTTGAGSDTEITLSYVEVS